jgi:two-component system sensor histidine kinase AtoS
MQVDGERTFTGIIHDLTARKKIEAELRERSELARLGQMASVVAHEVRNPLAGIRGALEVIRARSAGATSEHAVLGDVIARLDALNQFVDDLLVFSRPKPPALMPTRLKPLLQRLVELIRGDPQFADVAIEMEGDDAVVPLDPQRMERALLNLLTNAAQAIKGAGTIRIRLETTADECRVSISDSGPGLPPDTHDRIFEPFFTTKHRGTGLGLPITKRAIEQHGGAITVESAPGAGTTVRVRLPLTPAEVAAPTGASRTEQA